MFEFESCLMKLKCVFELPVCFIFYECFHHAKLPIIATKNHTKFLLLCFLPNKVSNVLRAMVGIIWINSVMSIVSLVIIKLVNYKVNYMDSRHFVNLETSKRTNASITIVCSIYHLYIYQAVIKSHIITT